MIFTNIKQQRYDIVSEMKEANNVVEKKKQQTGTQVKVRKSDDDAENVCEATQCHI